MNHAFALRKQAGASHGFRLDVGRDCDRLESPKRQQGFERAMIPHAGSIFVLFGGKVDDPTPRLDAANHLRPKRVLRTNFFPGLLKIRIEV